MTLSYSFLLTERGRQIPSPINLILGYTRLEGFQKLSLRISVCEWNQGVTPALMPPSLSCLLFSPAKRC